MSDLELVDTDDLIIELSNRHAELIVIRDHQKTGNHDKVFVKTPFGDLADKDKGFDLIHATDMLQATHKQLEMEYLEKKMANNKESGVSGEIKTGDYLGKRNCFLCPHCKHINAISGDEWPDGIGCENRECNMTFELPSQPTGKITQQTQHGKQH